MTAPLPSRVKPGIVEIVQLSDLHILPLPGDTLLGVDTARYFRKVLDLALQEHPQADLILLSGDLAQTPTAASYGRIAAACAQIAAPVLCLPGNHDDVAEMETALAGANISCCKQTLLHGWHIVCLNSQQPGNPSGYLAKVELERLEIMLHVYPQHPTLIAVHHPCCTVGSTWLDSQRIANSAMLIDILEQHKQVRALTSGHVHQVIDRSLGALRIFSAPSTCFQFRPGSKDFAIEKTPPGYRWFRLHPDGGIESGISRLPGELSELRGDLRGY